MQAFDLLDENGSGALSRMEVLRGLKSKPKVRELLQMGPFTNQAEFDAVYKTIDADGRDSSCAYAADWPVWRMNGHYWPLDARRPCATHVRDIRNA